MCYYLLLAILHKEGRCISTNAGNVNNYLLGFFVVVVLHMVFQISELSNKGTTWLLSFWSCSTCFILSQVKAEEFYGNEKTCHRGFAGNKTVDTVNLYLLFIFSILLLLFFALSSGFFFFVLILLFQLFILHLQSHSCLVIFALLLYLLKNCAMMMTH